MPGLTCRDPCYRLVEVDGSNRRCAQVVVVVPMAHMGVAPPVGVAFADGADALLSKEVSGSGYSDGDDGIVVWLWAAWV